VKKNCVFGPVPSRRFGRSLGIDLVPLKVCSMSCAYCQLGKTAEPTLERKAYVTLEDVQRDLPGALERAGDFDVATFSGSGEPTLNSSLGDIIRYVKTKTRNPIVVLTNGTLLWMPEVREDLRVADVIAPSLDAATDEMLQRLNRPAPGLDLEKIVSGMEEFSAEFAGEIRLEVFLAEGVNDSEEHVAAIASLARRIGPSRVELNTAERRPTEDWVRPVPYERLLELATFFDPPADIISSRSSPDGAAHHSHEPSAEEILEYLARRPAPAVELAKALGAPDDAVQALCEKLCTEGKLRAETMLEHEVFVVP